MKKIIGLFLAFALVFFPVAPAHAYGYDGTLIDAITLDDSPTSYTSSALVIKETQKIGFYVAYDETQVGNTVSGTFTIETSYDGTNWITASFYDFAGGATLQTSEVLSADGFYYCWLNTDSAFKYIRVKMAGTSTDADDTILTSVNYVALT